MTVVKSTAKNATALSSIPEDAYSAKVETFVAKVAPSSTTASNGQAGYGAFLSDRASRMGSYSITSSQDTYRALNASLLSKSGKR